jgi:hypothetical protein
MLFCKTRPSLAEAEDIDSPMAAFRIALAAARRVTRNSNDADHALMCRMDSTSQRLYLNPKPLTRLSESIRHATLPGVRMPFEASVMYT